MRQLKKLYCLIILFIIVSASFLITTFPRVPSSLKLTNQNNLHNSGQTLHTEQWLKNNNFSTQDEWFLTKGDQGDNSTVNGTISGGSANFIVLGDNQTVEISNPLDDGTWQKYRNDLFLYPDISTINSEGIYVTHDYDESVNQSRNYHSAHWRKNVSMGLDMSKYDITYAFLNVTFNASVVADENNNGADGGLEVLGDATAANQFGIGDFINIYVLISDIDFENPYTVALNKTTDLGEDSAGANDNITDSPIYSYGEDVIITALNSAFEKDPTHSNFTLTFGIDVYCEDNWGGDRDIFNYIYIKDYNLTLTYEKKTEEFTSISWNQEGNNITGSNVQISEAKLIFNAKISQLWPTALSPFSEIRILINDNLHSETVRLSALNTTNDLIWPGGIDVTNLILKDVNITLAIQVFIADTFSLGKNITISIDDVFLNISYYETFPDYTTDIDLFLNNLNKTQEKVIQIPINKILNVTIKYTNQSTGLHIPNATVQLGGDFIASLSENSTLKQYSIIFNTSQLTIGIKSLIVEAKKNNYETQSITFFVTVVERATELLIFVDNNQIDDGKTFYSGINEILNVTANFRDNSTKKFLIGANLELLSMNNLTETANYYNITINTNELDQGINVLLIYAQLENYTSQTFQLFIELNERDTEFELYINNLQHFESDTLNVVINEILNITVFFQDSLTQQHLSGANVELLGVNNLTETGSQYNIMINSINLKQGINVLIINAQLENYTSQTFQFFIKLNERDTEFELYVNNIQHFESDTLDVVINEILNISVFFHDNITQQHLSGASVELLGVDNLTETGNYYNITISTNDLEQGINVFIISAYLSNFTSQTFQFFIDLNDRDTTLLLFVNATLTFDGNTIIIKTNETLSVSVFYRDSLTDTHLSGASVELLGVDNLTETVSSYILTITTQNLNPGVTKFTITAQSNNFQSQTIQFNVKVVERATELQLFLNWEIKTSDPVIELPLGSILNITIKFTENQSGLFIRNSLIQLIGESLSINFIENLNYKQHSFILNTTILKIGVNLLTITANATSFQIETTYLRITINKITAVISFASGDPYINIIPGESVKLRIMLNDSDFGAHINNAKVNYRWTYGKGNLTDPDNDGIFEVDLLEIPEGSYTITITASAGDNYNFKSYEITVSAIRPLQEDQSWIVYVLSGGIVGLVSIFSVYQLHFKYPLLVRKIRKLRKKIRKGKKMKPMMISKREETIEIVLQNQTKILDFESENKYPNKIEKPNKKNVMGS